MNFYTQLIEQTQAEQHAFMQRAIITDTLAGNISLQRYQAFLTQAYHHVKHTVPLLMACGSRLTPELSWLQKAIAEYIEEELGHEHWILNDLEATGISPEQTTQQPPAFATEQMLAYAYHQVDRGNPLAFFGMVYVLESTSTALATHTAGLVQQQLNLSDEAFSYLRSHGALDLEHMEFFAGLMNNITDSKQQAVIIHAVKAFYRLYGEVLSYAGEQT